MDIWLKLFDMFNAAGAMLAKYVPQNKEEVLGLLRQGWNLLGGLNVWVGNVLGIDIQKIINIFAELVIKYFSLAFNFLAELVKRMAGEA